MAHPAERLTGTRSDRLKGRKVVLGVSGSIAAVETVKLVHELKRHGADVVVVMSRAAQRFITPLALQFASGNPVITQLTGDGEHVALCDGRRGSGDVLLLAPTTANTLAKVALAIDDTPVTSCATVALGAGVPVVVAPAMHDVMHTNKAVQTRIEELHGMGVHFVEPVIEEEKAKLASPAAVVDHVIRALADGPWVGRKAIVISGATAERVDPIRVITNRSSGRMGVELARALFHAGADVELWNAWGLVPLPEYVTTRRFETVDELFQLVRDRWIKDLAGVFMPAALSDFAPVTAKSKIGSDVEKLSVEMRPLPKVILEVRKKAPRAVLVGFKAESEASTLKARAEDRLERYKADIMVANTTGGFGGPTTEVLIVDGKGKSRTLKGLKAEVARAIVETAGKRLGDKGRRA